MIALQDVGLNNLNIHGVETPEEHGAHLKTDQDAAFGDWRRREDYRANQQRKLATIKLAARPTDDPTLPQGVKAGIVQLASRGLPYEAALQALSAELPRQLQIHPTLDPQKAVAALQAAYRQPTGSRPPGGVNALVDSVLSGGSGGGARVGPMVIRNLRPISEVNAAPPSSQKTVSAAELAAVAQRRGTSVEQEAQRAAAAGYIVR
jgi:hypothetical protein